MKTTIALLSVLLIGVSVGFYLDHTRLTKMNEVLTSEKTKIKSISTKQTSTIKTLLECANLTEKTYQETKKYYSINYCIKSRLNVQ